MGLFFAMQAFAHEGHDHDSPRVALAPKGGVIKSLEQTSVEVVTKGKELFIYFYDHDMKPQTAADYVVKAKAELPRTKKQEQISLTPKDTWFEASFDAKGSHRYTLVLTIKDPKTGHDGQLKYTIEPKK